MLRNFVACLNRKGSKGGGLATGRCNCSHSLRLMASKNASVLNGKSKPRNIKIHELIIFHVMIIPPILYWLTSCHWMVGQGRAPSTESDSQVEEIINVHNVARNGDLETLLLAYLKGADLMAPDAQGNTPLHCAAKKDQRSAARGLMALLMPQTSWNVKNLEGETPMDVASPRVKKDMRLISMKAAEIMDQHTQVNKRLVQERLQNPNENHKVLLSIDGGGIKAILIMGTLLAIERELGEAIMTRVHWLGGTSCGGIISLCLGVGYGCELARKLFIEGRKETFCGNKATFPKHLSSGIEKSLKKNLGAHTKMADIKTHRQEAL